MFIRKLETIRWIVAESIDFLGFLACLTLAGNTMIQVRLTWLARRFCVLLHLNQVSNQVRTTIHHDYLKDLKYR